MRVVQASEFKAKCLRLMEEVARSGEEIIVTKNGKAITKLVPYREPVGSLFGLHRNQIAIHDDIVSPIDEPWDADR